MNPDGNPDANGHEKYWWVYALVTIIVIAFGAGIVFWALYHLYFWTSGLG